MIWLSCERETDRGEHFPLYRACIRASVCVSIATLPPLTRKKEAFFLGRAANNETDFDQSLLAHLSYLCLRLDRFKRYTRHPYEPNEFSSFRLIVYPFFNTHGFPVFANYDYPSRERNIVGIDNKSIVYERERERERDWNQAFNESRLKYSPSLPRLVNNKGKMVRNGDFHDEWASERTGHRANIRRDVRNSWGSTTWTSWPCIFHGQGDQCRVG